MSASRNTLYDDDYYDEWRTKRTRISAMTLGCLSGLIRKARQWLVSRTKAVCMISNGKAKLRGLSPCHAPSDEVLMLVMLGGNMIAYNLDFVFEG